MTNAAALAPRRTRPVWVWGYALVGVVVGLIVGSTRLLTAQSQVPPVATIQELRIVSSHFSTSISGSQNVRTATNPSVSRFVVMKLTGRVTQRVRVFNTDFTLRYTRSGNEDRGQCQAVGPANTPQPGELGILAVADVLGWVDLAVGDAYFGLACFLENEVTTFDLHVLGKAEAIVHRLPAGARRYSVKVFSNRPDDQMTQAKMIIEAGNYDVFASSTLAADQTGPIVHYRAPSETQAREISQRLTARFGIIPTLREMVFPNDSDVVVWLGR
jgi:hypothetical protein